MIPTRWSGCYSKSWQDLIVPEAFCHPAKVSRGLIHRLDRHRLDQGYVKPEDHVIDPFGGICGTALEKEAGSAPEAAPGTVARYANEEKRMSERFTQCELRQGTRYTVGWIPAVVARRGCRVELPDVAPGWWEVVSVFASLSEEAVRVQERAYKAFQGSTRGGGIDG